MDVEVRRRLGDGDPDPFAKYDLAYPDFPVRQSLVPLRHRRLRVGGKFCLDIHFVPGEGQTWGEV